MPKLDLASVLELVPVTSLLRLTSVPLPTAPMDITEITHTIARLTVITVPTTSMTAFLSARVRGSAASTADITVPDIVISAATMGEDSVIVAISAISMASAIFMVGVTSMAEDSAAMAVFMEVDSAAGISSKVVADSMAEAVVADSMAEAVVADSMAEAVVV